MKKKIFAVLFFLFLIDLLSAISLNRSVTIKGRIQVFGNVPFEYPAIVTEKNQFIKIVDGKFTKDELLRYQGRRLEITGIMTKEKYGTDVEYFIEISEIKIIY